MERIEPEEQDFDPENFDAEADARAFEEGVRLFNAGEYHASHEAFEKCWLKSESADTDFYKGLIQAAICMHHLSRSNVEGARKLYSGHRRLLGAYLPQHRGVDVKGLVAGMQRTVSPVLRAGDSSGVQLEQGQGPRIDLAGD